jgi:lipopolysaccharide assembly outer membrane protein LptD (OstA)
VQECEERACAVRVTERQNPDVTFNQRVTGGGPAGDLTGNPAWQWEGFCLGCRAMTRFRAHVLLLAFLFAMGFSAGAQTNDTEKGEVFAGEMTSDLNTGLTTLWSSPTNRLLVIHQGAVLTADRATVDKETGEVIADGNVRLQQDNQVWIGEHMHYNYKTRQMISDEFRTGKAPVFAEGHGLSGDITNHIYDATNALITVDDFSTPAIRIKAQHMRIIPGKRFEATHAVLYLGYVPVFYFPYYYRDLEKDANHFNIIPGYRTEYGPFVLGNYTWYAGKKLDGEIHLDYREARGVGAGPDLNFHLGNWGDGSFRYYYTHDNDPQTNAALNAPVFENRQRLYFYYNVNPVTNVSVKALVQYQSDIGVIRDFFESEYRRDPQPDTFVEANKFWDNFSLDILTRPRVNDFYETVERLPDVRLSGFRQQIGNTPLYYESESSAGYYQRLFAETNDAPPGMNYEAERADTFHQITLPETFFGWLNVTPRAGGRFTYYSESQGPGASTDESYRGVFNTGAEVTFKASRLWPDVESKFLQMDGLRHIIQPSVNYVYVPRPNVRPNEVPQFDYELPSLLLLPIEYPEYNSIDSVDSQNVLRFGLANKLQTKRDGKVEDFLNWELYTDWRLRPNTNQETFADLYSDLALRPRSWLVLESQTRFDINDRDWRMLLDTLTFEPNDTWSWSVGHYYLRDDNSTSPTSLGPGNNLIISSMFYRLNENWGFRAVHHYDLRQSLMREQYYTLYRDFRSWTAAITGGLRQSTPTSSQDFLITFTFSLKAHPHYALGTDSVKPYSLLGR